MPKPLRKKSSVQIKWEEKRNKTKTKRGPFTKNNTQTFQNDLAKSI
jgi:hypothetical protein